MPQFRLLVGGRTIEGKGKEGKQKRNDQGAGGLTWLGWHHPRC